MEEWWRAFFSGPYLDVQRRGKSSERTSAEAVLLIKLLQIALPMNILDIPCGEGRLSVALAMRGFQVTGVDITKSLLEDARRKAAVDKVQVRWLHTDMRDIPFVEDFEAAICLGGSFGYFDDKGNKQFVEAVYHALRPGGRFLIDTPVIESLLPQFQKRDWSQEDQMLILQDRQYDHEQSRIVTRYIMLRDGNATEQTISIRLYTYHELSALLASLGFVRIRGYGTLAGEPFGLGARRLFMVAEKES